MESQRQMARSPPKLLVSRPSISETDTIYVQHRQTPKDEFKLIVVPSTKERQVTKLPDIRRRPGPSAEYRLHSPAPSSTSDRDHHERMQQIDGGLSDSEDIPLGDISNHVVSSQPPSNRYDYQTVSLNRKDTRQFQPVANGSPRRIAKVPFHQTVTRISKDINSSRSPLPAIKRKWIVSTRPMSHSGDRRLFTKEQDSTDIYFTSIRKKYTGGRSSGENSEDIAGYTVKTSKDVRQKLMRLLNTDMIGVDAIVKTHYGKFKVTYLDYIASGKPLKCIETYIRKHVMPFYANTHTTVSYTGMQTTLFREEAREIIRKSVNAGDDDYVIFTGSGVTASINKIVHTLNIGPDREEDVSVFVGPYEHHSNILPWMTTKATVTRILQTADGLIDVSSLATHLERVWNNPSGAKGTKPLIIGAFSAASNVTGVLTPVDEISSLIHRYNGYVIWDYACAGPYEKIDMNPSTTSPDSKTHKDAVVVSPHKFVGGPGTPGVLIAKKWMFQNPTPHNVGGGTVLFVRREHHVFLPNPEHSEEGGTPAILESIRAGLVFKLKDAVGTDYIMKREEIVMKKALTYLKEVPGLVILGNPRVPRLSILSLMFYHDKLGRFIHHDFMATLFNDIFGIQVRSGCACAAPYGLDLLGMGEEVASMYETFVVKSQKSSGLPFKNIIYKPGFVRFSLPYFITQECLDFVLTAIHMTAMHGWAMLPQYTYNRLTGQWTPRFKKAHYTLNTNHLSDVQFKSGAMKVALPFQDDKDSSDSLSDNTSSSKKSLVDYEAILSKAESLFRDALAGAYDCHETEEEKGDTEEHEEELRWFVKPVEAANLIHGRRVASLDPDDLPFMPGALAAKINYNPRGHKGRGQTMDGDFIMEYHPDQKT